jgi:hypothetical protein
VLDDLQREAMAAIAEQGHGYTLPDPPTTPDSVSVTMPARDFVPSVRFATVEASPGTFSVTLAGTTAAFAAANIFACATGYIVKRNVDIGDDVGGGPRVIAESVVMRGVDFAAGSGATNNCTRQQ